jgi:hypothetical protein
LVKHGVPWDVAFSLPRPDALGMVVAMGELDGGNFLWDAMKWEDRR